MSIQLHYGSKGSLHLRPSVVIMDRALRNKPIEACRSLPFSPFFPCFVMKHIKKEVARKFVSQSTLGGCYKIYNRAAGEIPKWREGCVYNKCGNKSRLPLLNKLLSSGYQLPGTLVSVTKFSSTTARMYRYVWILDLTHDVGTGPVKPGI